MGVLIIRAQLFEVYMRVPERLPKSVPQRVSDSEQLPADPSVIVRWAKDFQP